MPALVNSNVGSLRGTSGDDATTVCCRSRKKSRKEALTSARLVMAVYVAVTLRAVIPAPRNSGFPPLERRGDMKTKGRPWRERPFAGVVPSCQQRNERCQ